MQLYANFELTASNYQCLAVNNLNTVEVFWRDFHPDYFNMVFHHEASPTFIFYGHH